MDNILIVLLVLGWHGASAWDYADQGRSWISSHQQFCSGRRQSPIDLGVGSSRQDSSLREFAFNQLDAATAYTATVTNDGHSVKLSWSSQYVVQMGLSSGNLHFTAEQLHYHWGSDSSRGSEHTVDGRSYVAEAHLVFYNSRDYANFSDAVAKPNGLAVLGVFLQESASNNSLLAALQPLVDTEAVRNASGQQTAGRTVGTLNVVDLLLPSDRSSYYRYDGSLTTPVCFETVMWTVFKEPMPISASQLAMLRRLRFTNSSPMQNNYREVQELNPASTNRPGTRRELYRSFSAAPSLRAAASFVAAAAAAVLLLAA